MPVRQTLVLKANDFFLELGVWWCSWCLHYSSVNTTDTSVFLAGYSTLTLLRWSTVPILYDYRQYISQHLWVLYVCSAPVSQRTAQHDRIQDARPWSWIRFDFLLELQQSSSAAQSISVDFAAALLFWSWFSIPLRKVLLHFQLQSVQRPTLKYSSTSQRDQSHIFWSTMLIRSFHLRWINREASEKKLCAVVAEWIFLFPAQFD